MSTEEYRIIGHIDHMEEVIRKQIHGWYEDEEHVPDQKRVTFHNIAVAMRQFIPTVSDSIDRVYYLYTLQKYYTFFANVIHLEQHNGLERVIFALDLWYYMIRLAWVAAKMERILCKNGIQIEGRSPVNEN